MDSGYQGSKTITRSAPSQTISSQRIDPAKLSLLLTKRFGQKAYRVEMRHNRFSIFARGSLSQEEIDQCSYGPIS
ncbi:hypothetical protein LZ31DRAFT_180810 [Colletotrichum somersetense]|nr:hypothetical protein LZ31DRAFT_180810 [Colletotrichum somersetense]